MRRDISDQKEVDELREVLPRFNEQRVYLERHSLPRGFEVIQVNFYRGATFSCSLCGVGIGFHPDGERFYDQTGFLTTVKVRFRDKRDIFILRKVLLCYSCKDRLTRRSMWRGYKIGSFREPSHSKNS